jgi:hypothetical protein
VIELELDLAKNMFGALEPEYRDRLRRLYDNPCIETWDDAYSIIVGSDRWMTLWQAVCKIDPSFSTIGQVTDRQGNVLKEWGKIPSRQLIREALIFATH